MASCLKSLCFVYIFKLIFLLHKTALFLPIYKPNYTKKYKNICQATLLEICLKGKTNLKNVNALSKFSEYISKICSSFLFFLVVTYIV